MNKEKINSFVEALVKDTLSGYIEWVYVDSLADEMVRDAGTFPPELSGNEFAEVDFHRAYACQTNAGSIYLLYTLVEPGDGSNPYEGFELFLHPSPYNLSKYFLVLDQSDKLYRLENAIKTKVSSTLRPWNYTDEHYIDLYLQASKGFSPSKH